MANALLKPAAVGAGAGIGIISPASFASQKAIDAGFSRLRGLGYVPHLATHAATRGPLFFAGTPEQRLSDLYKAFADPETRAVISMRGGYGSNYLLDQLDFNLLRAHPKPFLAYSDLTGLALAVLDRTGIPAFHGPMLAIDFCLEEGVHLPSLHAALAGEPYTLGAAEGLHVLKPGKASGTLYGGCLSILVTMLGTPWAPQTEGKLLFIEDVDTKPYQIDRMLWQMLYAGKFKGVTGIVFGEMRGCTSPGEGPEMLHQAILNALDGFDGPIAFGLRSGHVTKHNVTLTFGVQAELISGPESELRILEAAVKS